jgi:hypothetical protein
MHSGNVGYALEPENVLFLPAGARGARRVVRCPAEDVHVVLLAQGLSGLVVPSREYGVLAEGGRSSCPSRRRVRWRSSLKDIDCGGAVAPGRPSELASAIRSAHSGELDLEAIGGRTGGAGTPSARRRATSRCRATAPSSIGSWAGDVYDRRSVTLNERSAPMDETEVEARPGGELTAVLGNPATWLYLRSFARCRPRDAGVT